MNNPVDSTADERALGVFPPKESALGSIFGTDRVVIGVVHCPRSPAVPTTAASRSRT